MGLSRDRQPGDVILFIAAFSALPWPHTVTHVKEGVASADVAVIVYRTETHIRLTAVS